MTPTIGPRNGKIWGVTQLGFALNGVEAHAIHVEAGGYCSRHSHVSKWNRFQVLRGRLMVRLYINGDGSSDDTIVGVGQVTDVPPGVRHEFEALEDVIAVEYYWTVIDGGDIDRGGTQGGRRSL